MWKATEKWRPCRLNTASGGFGVQCSVTEHLGYAKPKDIYQEKLASDFAAKIGVPVPEIRLDEIEGKSGTHAISIAFGKESNDLTKVRAANAITAEVKAALAQASGLLAFHTWVGTGDLKEEHVLVSTLDDGGTIVAAIDFASAFAWPVGGGTVQAPTSEPKGLIENVNKTAVEAAVNRIEGMFDDDIRQAVAAIPERLLPLAERDRVANGLISRRGSIRAVLKARGWLP